MQTIRDVTAVVLSIGEDYTERAIASVRRQTLPVVETIVVRGLSPFYRAINHGAARVQTRFFIQVDADMILDDACIADLRGCMSDRVGVVLGQLRDPLRGRVVGVKLFRTRCFDRVQFRDTVCQDNDFSDEILQHEGWRSAYALSYAGAQPAVWHSFGDHRPDYTPHYTFCKFRVEGARAGHRKGQAKFRSLFQQLRSGTDGIAVIAVIATAHGLFVSENRDLLVPYTRDEEFEFLERFLQSAAGHSASGPVPDDLAVKNLVEGFKRSYKRGVDFRHQQEAAAFIAALRRLHQQDSTAAAVALVGLCHGLFCAEYRDAEVEEAFALLMQLLPANGRG